MAKAGNLKLDFMAKSIGINFFGLEDIFRCYRDDENLKQPFGRMDTLRVYMVFEDAVSKLETFVWILNHISKSITLSPFTLKASYLVK